MKNKNLFHMAEVKVKVLKTVDTSFPTFVEFELIDCNDVSHHFIDKVPIICCDHDPIPHLVSDICVAILSKKQIEHLLLIPDRPMILSH